MAAGLLLSVAHRLDRRLHPLGGHGQEAGEADDVRLELEGLARDFVRRDVHAEVVHHDPVGAQHHDDDVLAQVVDVAAHGAQQDGALPGLGRLLREQGAEVDHGLPEDLAGHDETGDEVLAGLIVLPDPAHAELALLDDHQRVVPGLDARCDRVERALLVEHGDARGERCGVEPLELGHLRFLLAPSPSGAGAPTLARNENRSPRQMKQPQLIGRSS